MPAGPPRIAIIGAGAAGICAAVRLQQAGFDRITVLERSDGVGGTWHDNSYPGAACDVQSHLYSFSFEPKRDWSRLFAGRDEIRAYLEDVVGRHGLLPRIRLGTTVVSARFEERGQHWRLRTASGEEVEADVVVSALGQLNRPHVPDIPGAATFAGPAFHSARWRHDVDLAGRRVAVVGSAASAVQLVPPVARTAAHVDVYQRSPNWIIPRGDRPYTAAELRRLERIPGAAWLHRQRLYWGLEGQFASYARRGRLARRLERIALDHLERQVPDPALRAALRPDYPIGCKRVLITDDYYPALVRPDVELVTSPIRRLGPEGPVTADGRTRPADVVVWATGFHTTDMLSTIDVEGRGGRSLATAWADGPVAHLGLTVAGFPNLFLLYGPNTNLGHGSIIFMIECQVGYVVRTLRSLRRRAAGVVDVRPEVQRRSDERVQRDLARSSWAGGCTSWYKDASGRITQNWSGTMTGYWLRTRRPALGDYDVG